MQMTRMTRALVVAATLLAVAAGVHADDVRWPSKPVRMVVPHAPGGGTDLLARTLAERLQTALGQPFIVENKPGAGINIGTMHVARQAPDGHSLLVTTNTHAMNVAFYRNLPYDPIRDFTPVSLIATSPLLLVVNAASPARTVSDMVAIARTRPGSFSYASTGTGTPQHLAPAMMESALGLKMLHVAYKGAGPATVALLSGEVDMAVGAVNSLLQHTRSGKLRALAVADATRSKLLPNVPTLAEALAMPDFSVQLWYAVLAPAGTPRPIVDRLNAEINKIMRDPALQADKLAPLGLEGVGSTPEQLTGVMQSDIPKYVRAAQLARIELE